MKRFPVLGVLLLIPAMSLAYLTGCREANDDKPAPPAPVGGGGKGGAKSQIKAPGNGVIKGVVSFDGDAPKAEDEPEIPRHEDAAICLAGGGIHVKKQLWLVDKNKGVANVVIFIEPGDGREYRVDDKMKDWFKKNPSVIDQPFCQYTPHTAAVYADIQELKVTNTSKKNHNVRIKCPKQNPDSDDIMVPNGKPVVRTFKNEIKPIRLSSACCGWMTGNVWTVPHPYFAVTKLDGTFEIKDVPTGEDLVIFMWHESMGDVKTKVETRKFNQGDNELKLRIK